MDRSQATVDDARQKYERAKELAAQSLLPKSDLDSAKAAFDGAVADNRASQSSVAQAAASVNQAKVDLEHTVIQAPIDGVVLARNVDVGQTVAASLQAPTLFVIANDLSQMVEEMAQTRVQLAQTMTGLLMSVASVSLLVGGSAS